MPLDVGTETNWCWQQNQHRVEYTPTLSGGQKLIFGLPPSHYSARILGMTPGISGPHPKGRRTVIISLGLW